MKGKWFGYYALMTILFAMLFPGCSAGQDSTIPVQNTPIAIPDTATPIPFTPTVSPDTPTPIPITPTILPNTATPIPTSVMKNSAFLSAEECQGKLRDFLALRSTFDHFTSKAKVSEYFSVLDHLKYETGYILDYYFVSNEDWAGYPILYARPVNQIALPDQSFEGQSPGESNLPEDQANWEKHIEIDDTASGYFEHVLLLELGSQFNLQWHAASGDWTVICDPSGLQKEMEEHNIEANAPDFWEQANKYDLEPKFKFEDDVVEVQIMIFKSYPGLSRMTYKISRSFPHEVLETDYENLIECNCGVVY